MAGGRASHTPFWRQELLGTYVPYQPLSGGISSVPRGTTEYCTGRYYYYVAGKLYKYLLPLACLVVSGGTTALVVQIVSSDDSPRPPPLPLPPSPSPLPPPPPSFAPCLFSEQSVVAAQDSRRPGTRRLVWISPDLSPSPGPPKVQGSPSLVGSGRASHGKARRCKARHGMAWHGIAAHRITSHRIAYCPGALEGRGKAKESTWRGLSVATRPWCHQVGKCRTRVTIQKLESSFLQVPQVPQVPMADSMWEKVS
ncbi:hypothetical protein MBM_09062 [Drepanopeziza brunnea f. sp. 'multigermtubi' MB_m1]|uniref:Uncharacterized protein n=1 Tax=Marssonina brunnea f. sp. multigermtubi (strain MB_m1) TaxID=1072389 RepID=K1WVW3_MARBU|nr:uncharacterized protein MBM_09062 [Drepanopeziza brunnea f. sp. 'multigermtubi' MB_m1]EKD12833.1 hypothetical protein MBM_09062 [Drepanopeziza brunnea f. sp. 'multigermtubi' MB_m1]